MTMFFFFESLVNVRGLEGYVTIILMMCTLVARAASEDFITTQGYSIP